MRSAHRTVSATTLFTNDSMHVLSSCLNVSRKYAFSLFWFSEMQIWINWLFCRHVCMHLLINRLCVVAKKLDPVVSRTWTRDCNRMRNARGVAAEDSCDSLCHCSCPRLYRSTRWLHSSICTRNQQQLNGASACFEEFLIGDSIFRCRKSSGGTVTW
jgi:hypothetical protein